MAQNTNGSTEIQEPKPKVQKLDDRNGNKLPIFKVKKLSENAVLPSRGSSLAAGYDLSSATKTKVPARGKALVPTDLSIAVPEGTYARIAPRSGLAWKHSIDVGAGVIDADYRGPVGVILFNHSDTDFEVKCGDRIAQLIIEKIITPQVIEVDDLDSTERGAGIELVGEYLNQKKRKIDWKKEGLVQTFLEACLHETIKNGREGSSLTAQSWKNVGEELKKKHNFIVNQRQMKNQYDYIKGKYAAWSKLKNKTGNIYDPSTNTFNSSEEKWKIEISQSRYMESLRSTNVLFPELCVQLFDGVANVGLESYGTTPTIPDPYDSDSNLNEDISDTQETGGPTSTQECSSHSPVQSKKRTTKEACTSKKAEVEETILKVMNVMLEKYGAPKDDIDECLKKLEELGWGEQLHDMALFILAENADYRKMWMRLEPAKCEIWIKQLMTCKYGL